MTANVELITDIDDKLFVRVNEYDKRRVYVEGRGGDTIEVTWSFLYHALLRLSENKLDRLYRLVKREHEKKRERIDQAYSDWDMTEEWSRLGG